MSRGEGARAGLMNVTTVVWESFGLLLMMFGP
jgi:hypothetical protein